MCQKLIFESQQFFHFHLSTSNHLFERFCGTTSTTLDLNVSVVPCWTFCKESFLRGFFVKSYIYSATFRRNVHFFARVCPINRGWEQVAIPVKKVEKNLWNLPLATSCEIMSADARKRVEIKTHPAHWYNNGKPEIDNQISFLTS